jgi:hypothetical protein
MASSDYRALTPSSSHSCLKVNCRLKLCKLFVEALRLDLASIPKSPRLRPFSGSQHHSDVNLAVGLELLCPATVSKMVFRPKDAGSPLTCLVGPCRGCVTTDLWHSCIPQADLPQGVISVFHAFAPGLAFAVDPKIRRTVGMATTARL